MRKLFIIFFICLGNTCALAATDPWFTGPLLANAGETLEKNKFNFQPYYYYILNKSESIRHTRVPTSIVKINNVFDFQANLGITDALDAQVDANFNHNVQEGKNYTGIGDTNLMLGYQIMTQGHNPNKPSIRLTVQQTIPTGRFKNLNVLANGTDAVGLGSDQTNFGFNMQQVNEVMLGHYLQTTFNVNYLYAPTVLVMNHNVYGGDESTDGRVDPGHLVSLDFALELSLTQNWVAVFETFCAYRYKSSFRSNVPVSPNHSIGSPAINEITLAPAIEYNVTENFGLIAGEWFSIGGKNTPAFYTPVFSFSYVF